jgi:glycosyltransferase involved in cell wall biosynthesis
MKIGVIFEGSLSSGGGFQQALNMVLLFREKKINDREFVFFTTNHENLMDLGQKGIEAHFFRISRLQRWIIRARRHIRLNRLCEKLGLRNAFDRIFESHDIDILYFASATGLALLTEKHNYIYTVWDLCHRDHPEFPEVRGSREFEAREEMLKQALPKATAVLADSSLGQENLVRRYNLDLERVTILPFSPATSTDISEKDYQQEEINIRQKYGVSNPYIYYPAQFWPHKNHIYILKALQHLNHNGGPTFSAVFSGSPGDSYKHVCEQVDALGLAKQVHCIGFAPNEEIPYLYRQSVALVMPTWFGPTNLPPLEAFRLGVPVLYPDLAGLRDQVGDAALLMDLQDPTSLAIHLSRLITEDNLADSLREKGKLRFKELDGQDRWEILEEIFKDFEVKLTCWK